jgi:hypothetical protein
MENLQTFADIFGIKELEEQTPDTETTVHIATVQGMVQRLLYNAENDTPPAVDQYDCIIVDECHRGYLLDRELSDTELTFRSFDDYISKYRRVLDYFDAVKIGLTATPALQEHYASLEAYFRAHPPATIKEAQHKIEALTGIKRSETQVRAYCKKNSICVAAASGCSRPKPTPTSKRVSWWRSWSRA